MSAQIWSSCSAGKHQGNRRKKAQEAQKQTLELGVRICLPEGSNAFSALPSFLRVLRFFAAIAFEEFLSGSPLQDTRNRRRKKPRSIQPIFWGDCEFVVSVPSGGGCRDEY
jgi:hypothetical protein